VPVAADDFRLSALSPLPTTPERQGGSTVSETNVYRIWIKATPERIWRALTDPQELGGYGYGGRYEVDVRAGGEYRVGATDEMLQAARRS
jgi:hypothetical protein